MIAAISSGPPGETSQGPILPAACQGLERFRETSASEPQLSLMVNQQGEEPLCKAPPFMLPGPRLHGNLIIQQEQL